MKIFCSGIGGIGLSAYASLQRVAGHEVYGSDRSLSATTQDLTTRGIIVTTDQSGAEIPADADLFVYSEAIPASSPERMKAAVLGIAQISYPEAVSKLTGGKRLICVCGTHGKSSTTAMAARMLIELGLDPTVVVGTKMQELGGRNWREGKSDLFLLEACEYRRSFLHYHPEIILLTTCDGDHFDYYKGIADYQNAFVEFLKQLPDGGTVVTHLSDPDCASVVKRCGRSTIDADVFPLIDLKTPGMHMKQNARLVLGLGTVLGIPQEKIVESLAGFAGTWRRMERIGTYGDSVPVFDDYAHHPREIAATLEGIRSEAPEARLVCVFQPHTHDRTLKLYDDFVRCFRGCDLLLITDVYEARKDIETSKVDMNAFAKDVSDGSSVETVISGSLSDTEQSLRSKILKPGDVLLCMGAGDITNLSRSMVKNSA